AAAPRTPPPPARERLARTRPSANCPFSATPFPLKQQLSAMSWAGKRRLTARCSAGHEQLAERLHRSLRPLRMVPHRTAHREEIRARLDQRPSIVRRDAADGDARYLEQAGPPGEDRRVR